jgi:GT2 family glycosyltransferase
LQLRRYGLPLRQFRITTDIPWNMAGAKNLLHEKSTAEWLLYFDVDNRVDPQQLAMLALQVGQLDAKTVYWFPWILHGEEQAQPHINTFAIHRDTLERLGGFDEDFCGYYGLEDVLFHHIAQKHGVQRVVLQGMPFVAHIGATEGLSRDTSRNQALANAKGADPEYRVGQRIRFHWQEIPDLG